MMGYKPKSLTVILDGKVVEQDINIKWHTHMTNHEQELMEYLTSQNESVKVANEYFGGE